MSYTNQSLTLIFNNMLYLIESGLYAKIGYTSDLSTLEKRIQSYQTHNPLFNLVDITEGSKEDEEQLQALYKDYKSSPNTEWSYAKKLVTKIWIDYRASKENVDYYTEFGIGEVNTRQYGKIDTNASLLKALENNLITEKEIDLYEEFNNYYEE